MHHHAYHSVKCPRPLPYTCGLHCTCKTGSQQVTTCPSTNPSVQPSIPQVISFSFRTQNDSASAPSSPVQIRPSGSTCTHSEHRRVSTWNFLKGPRLMHKQTFTHSQWVGAEYLISWFTGFYLGCDLPLDLALDFCLSVLKLSKLPSMNSPCLNLH